MAVFKKSVCSLFSALCAGVLVAGLLLGSSQVFASKTEVIKGQEVGRKAAEPYFSKSIRSESLDEPGAAVHSRLLSLYVAHFMKSKSYQWGEDGIQQKPGVQMMGLSYKLGEWVKAMDFNLRLDYQQFELPKKNPIKVSIAPSVTFPDSEAHFPLYFGASAGPGIFLSQLEGESPITLDYSVFAGVRFNDLFHRGGFYAEFGTKDHLSVLTDGQLMGQYLALGLVFNL